MIVTTVLPLFRNIIAAGMYEPYGTYAGDECFGIHDYDDVTGHDTDDGTDDGTDGDNDTNDAGDGKHFTRSQVKPY